MTTTNPELNRRDLLKSATALTTVGAAALMTRAALGAEMQHNHHHHSGNPYQDLISSAQDCITTGNTCLDHCFQVLISGDEGKEMAKCAESVDEMLTMTNTLMELASKQSKHVKAFAALCKQTCEDCADNCKPHAEKHQACQDCMEACKACAKACGAFA